MYKGHLYLKLNHLFVRKYSSEVKNSRGVYGYQIMLSNDNVVSISRCLKGHKSVFYATNTDCSSRRVTRMEIITTTNIYMQCFWLIRRNKRLLCQKNISLISISCCQLLGTVAISVSTKQIQ